jgi:fatty acid amide hydrolase
MIDCSGSAIAGRVSAGECSAAEVLEAHLARIEEVDGRLNAVVARRFDEARREAAAVDQARKRAEPLGPLAGVPITVKECFHVAGLPTSIGIRDAARIADVDGPLVAALRRAGAIIVGKTNVPQLMMLYETDNPVYGRTNNPWDLRRSPGGSSGGEAAIIAAGGVPLGLGGDLAGSIRQPAHSCGVHGLKPTVGRLTNAGTMNSFLGSPVIGIQPGPLARSVADLALAMRILVQASQDSEAADVVPVAWRESSTIDVAALRIGFWTDDGYFPASPSIRRATHDAAAALTAAGAIVERIDPPDAAEAMRLFFGLVGADGGAASLEMLGASPVDWRVRDQLRMGRVRRWLKPAIARLIAISGRRRTAELFRAAAPISTDAYWRLNLERRHFIERSRARLREGRFDAVLTPPFALAALTHGSSLDLLPAASYAILPNLLNFPAGVIAATRIRPGEETDRPASRDRADRMAAKVEQSTAGLPVGVQVMALPWREDVVLAVMAALETHFRRQSDYPANPPIS